MAKILCSTGALIGRPNHRDYHLLQDLKAKLDCDGFEFMMYSTWYNEVDKIVDFLNDLHIDIPVMHCDKHIGEMISKGVDEENREALRLFEINCMMAQKLGTQKLVVHLWDGMTSDKYFENNLKTYKNLDTIIKKYNIDLLVENVVCNQFDPMKHWRQLAEVYPDVHFVFDTKMAAFHGQEKVLFEDDYAWLWRDNHIRHYHINDYGGGYMEWSKLHTLPLGKGKIDFDAFFRVLQKSGYDDTFTVEATAFGEDGTIDVEMLNRCFFEIREYMKIQK